ncbi:MAG TPA: isoprenylcysteine carboxylmethyltransferase family protein [Flavilitoribacter sp.]|nr:isoprenylcysteine carboxylmethyltransferase family protein [Flavilitoribacter sp.]HMQ90488.1 isoprenylcysteine carboxylmethyltransferase family protein [Flavilitoribacter sp.]
MANKKDHPGVYPPPPLFYVAIFLVSILMQKQFPLPALFFKTKAATIPGVIFVMTGIIFILPALIKFFKTKNTLVTIKPANSLQTSGIYAISRNPMYLGLMCLYTGIAFLKGNFWTLMFIPLVIWIITHFVILNEEKYLGRAFDQDYKAYRTKVRRWI